jgi:8-amino-7-oxononanoate synthase
MKDIILQINKLKEKGLYRELKYLGTAQGPYCIIESKKVMMLSSNNYLGLCNDSRLKKAACAAIEKYGVGSGGSRLLAGSFELHKELEEKIARFKGTEASIVFNTGYMANIGVISAIADKNWTIYCDRLNHASIIDGIRLSGAKLVIYKHADIGDLTKKIERYHSKKGLIITDGIFSMDGDIAPLKDIVDIAKKYDLLTMVDDAHATGVIGPNGAGTADYFGVKGKVDIQMGTLSKAIGSEGGYIAGNRELIDYLKNKARSFIYSTAIAPHNIAAAICALEIIKKEPERRSVLLKNAAFVKSELFGAGLVKNMIINDKLNEEEIINPKFIECGEEKKPITPIIPIMIGETNLCVEFSKRLFEEGLYIPAVRPPTVPEGTSRLRMTVTASHTEEDLRRAIDIIMKVAKVILK